MAHVASITKPFLYVVSEAGREAVLADAGCTVGGEGEDGALVVAPRAPEEAASADLTARTSRAFPDSLMSSVLLDSPPVLANATQCCLSAAEKVGHSFFNCSRTSCSLRMHSSKVALRPTDSGSAD